ncbi:ribonuclease E/G-like protein, chloroplastic isoform X1 [Nymphaea colorata]|nr:ribonuclease E/G-like protein, chloroplastic isoform X1 [Nymphaea colorata]
MEVIEAFPPRFALGCIPRRASLWCWGRFSLPNSSSPYWYHRGPLQNFPKTSFCKETVQHYFRAPLTLARKGSDGAGYGLCKVLWSIEAYVSEGHLLYVSGDCLALGSWDPKLAIAMSPCEDQPCLWMMEIEVPCGLNLRYSYFTKEAKSNFSDVVWKPGPEFSLSVPQHCSATHGKIMVNDSWMEARSDRFPALMWGSWLRELDDIQLPTELDQSLLPSTGSWSILESLKFDGEEWHACSDYIPDLNKAYTTDNEGSGDSIHSERRLDKYSFVDGLFVEEPWFIQLPAVFRDLVGDKVTDQVSGECDLLEFPDDGVAGNTEKEAVRKESKPTQIVQFVNTVILINSSICTMQRVAILEDEKLVELLLEPVKNNVQCGSVYLGVVTKLVPHMGGAFVDIGTSRPSLMEIKLSREPYVYPPFRCTDKGTEDDFSEMELQHGSLLHEDPEEQEDEEDELETSDSLKWKRIAGTDTWTGGSLGEPELEDCFGGNVQHVETELASELPVLASHNCDEVTQSHHAAPAKVMNPLNDNFASNKWRNVQKGTKVIVQVIKEELGTKGPALSAYPNLRSRFWVLSTRCARIGVSKKISGLERTRLKLIAKTLQPPGFGLTVRTVAAGHSLEELQKDLEGLLSTWKDIVEHAQAAVLAADEGVDGAVPVILHRAIGQTLSVVQDYFNEKVSSMVVDSPRTYHEVASYLQEVAPDLCGRVELYTKKVPIFDEYGIEEEINNILSKRVPLPNGGSLVIEQTEALVSIDVNGGHGMLGHGTSQQQAILDVNLVAARQIARELRLRDIGGIIVVDFIDMLDESNKRLVYEEIKKAVERDRSLVKISELSRHGLMEITRKRVRPSVTFMISEPCSCCHGTGRVEALETLFSKIEHEISRLLATMTEKPNTENAKSWPKFVLRVDRYMCNYLTSGKKTKLGVLSSSLKVWILLKVARGFGRGEFEVKAFADGKVNDEHEPATISRLHSTAPRSYMPNTKLTLFPVKKLKGQRR